MENTTNTDIMSEFSLNFTTVPELVWDDLSTMAMSRSLPPEMPSAHAQTKDDEGVMGSLTHVLVYASFGLLVCFGNGVTFLAVWKSPRLKSMTDFYIASLAVADFVVGITFIVTALTGISQVAKVFRENKYVCLAYLNAIVVALTASLLTLVFMSLDRCQCVMNPLSYKRSQRKRTHFCLIALVWVLSLAYAAVPYIGPMHFVRGAVCIATIQLPKWYIVYTHSIIGMSCFWTVAVCYILISVKHFKQVKKRGRGFQSKPDEFLQHPSSSSPKADCTTDSTSSIYKHTADGSPGGCERDIRPIRSRTGGIDNATKKVNTDRLNGIDKGQEPYAGNDTVSSAEDTEMAKRKRMECGEESIICIEHTRDSEASMNNARTHIDVAMIGRMTQRDTRPKSDNIMSYVSSNLSSMSNNQVMTKQSVRLVKMTFIILVVFFLCWFPGNIIIIVSEFVEVNSSIQMMFLVLTFLNSGLNVVIYVTMNRRYREAVLSVLCFFCNSCRNDGKVPN